MVEEINEFRVAKLKVLLEPLYSRYNEIICRYESSWQFNEFCFNEEDLEVSPDEKGLRLKRELIIEAVLNDVAICQIEGYTSKLIVPYGDLEILKK